MGVRRQLLGFLCALLPPTAATALSTDVLLEDIPVSTASFGTEGELYWATSDGTIGMIPTLEGSPIVLTNLASVLESHPAPVLPRGTVVRPSGVTRVIGWKNGARLILALRSEGWAAVFLYADGRTSILAEDVHPYWHGSPSVVDAGSEVCWAVKGATSVACTNKVTLKTTKLSVGMVLDLAAQGPARCWTDQEANAYCLSGPAATPKKVGEFTHIQLFDGRLYGEMIDQLFEVDVVTGKSAELVPKDGWGLRFFASRCGLLVAKGNRTVLRQGKAEWPLPPVNYTFMTGSGNTIAYGDLLRPGIHLLRCDPRSPLKRHLTERREH